MGPISSVDFAAIGTVTESLSWPGIHVIEVAVLKTPSHDEVPAATDPDDKRPVLFKILGNFLLGEHTSNTIIGDRRTSQILQDILDATAFIIIVVPIVAITAGIVTAIFITEIMEGSVRPCILRDFALFYVISIIPQYALAGSSPTPLVLFLLRKRNVQDLGIGESRQQ
jgi:hypothetical protein